MWAALRSAMPPLRGAAACISVRSLPACPLSLGLGGRETESEKSERPAGRGEARRGREALRGKAPGCPQGAA